MSIAVQQPEMPDTPGQWRGALHLPVVVAVAFYHAMALLALAPYFFSWTAVVVAILSTQVFAAGIGIGYHRLLAHRSFSCSKRVEHFLVILAVLSLQRGPAWWVAAHRRHHRFADRPQDPHRPRPSFLWAHMGWFFFVNENTDRSMMERYAKDLLKDRFYLWLETGYGWVWIIVASWAAYFAAGFLVVSIAGGSPAEAVRLGLSLLVWGVFVRTVYVWHLTWATASCTHLFGYRNYETPDRSVNNATLGILAAGEGWGNNHHAFPRRARYGVKWWEVDASWQAIRFLAWAGLATLNAADLSPRRLHPADGEGRRRRR